MASSADEVLQRERLRIQRLLAGDVDGVAELCHDELVYTHSVGFRDSKQTLLASLRTGALRYHAIEQDVDDVVALTGAIVIVGSQRTELTGAGRRMAGASLTSALWISESDRWMLRMFQGTALAASAP